MNTVYQFLPFSAPFCAPSYSYTSDIGMNYTCLQLLSLMSWANISWALWYLIAPIAANTLQVQDYIYFCFFLSGCLFTLVLAGALCDLRIKLVVEIDRPNPPMIELGLFLDTEYADEKKEKKLFCQWRLKFSKILTSSSMKTKQTSPTCTWLSLAWRTIKVSWLLAMSCGERASL